MAYNENLAESIRVVLLTRVSADEKKMFGGIAFMVSGHMTVGVQGEDLIVRVGLGQFQSALEMKGAELFQPTGKPMTGWVRVTPEGIQIENALQQWINMALGFVQSLPAK